MTQSSLFLSELCCSERLAIWSIRSMTGLSMPSCQLAARRPDSFFPECCRNGLEAAETALQEALQFMRDSAMELPEIGIPGTQQVFETEQRFLHAVESAQNGNQSAVRSILEPDFGHFYLQSRFSLALMLLADCLAGTGHWLPASHGNAFRQDTRRFGSPCLASVARWRSRAADISPRDVLWPQVSVGASLPVSVMH